MKTFGVKMKRICLLLLLIGVMLKGMAQVTGGQFSMEFLRLPNSPHVSALGGFGIISNDRDVTLAIQNPSLMRPGLHNQLALGYNSYYAGISITNLAYGYHLPKSNTSLILGVQYLNYGTFQQTDDIGNVYGDVKANEFALSVGASKQYKERWRYGAALKYASSHLFDKSSSAVLADVGITYYDTSSQWMLGVSAKNIGFVAKKYNPDHSAEPLPFDLQIGVCKQFKHIPFRLMATAHHLYEWDIRYDNPADISSNSLLGLSDTNASTKKYFGNKLFRHFTFAAELTLGHRVTATVGYNHLRRSELGLTDRKASAGFSFGLGLDLNKLQVHYARNYYHIAGAYNEFGLNLWLNKMMGIGKATDKIHWRTDFGDWH